MLFEKHAELLHLPAAEIAEIERWPVGVPVKMTVREEIIPVVSILVQREGKTEAFQVGAVLGDPSPPRLVPFGICLPPVGHSRLRRRRSHDPR